jgi:hypothetical protein
MNMLTIKQWNNFNLENFYLLSPCPLPLVPKKHLQFSI